ncbi:MAG TPA: universal stress protein [Algoriphagus sp.]|jgi:nucleotide-binding universal stress UspA family protein|uniref:Nucleotide-binding universal stress protein, UspA family n=1 Tax=Algoriphagus ornithinivorans TaxID=226506 RepID=A0A1I5C8V1_9BACT|nr:MULTISPECIES: universal stress protein [Algoriphagus]MAL11807.1 universal stress protein [Algoriphagus sp.]MAL14648.1 universal stress protein [Algoriphagus sp.]MAN86603.1 universal stress protein [Algoriphagus sp.]QYH38770.1 universal stress protein [Algoriphagus sp. NBT04N3]SFN83398.1 Nucleotide-binding universal stress protein, UspA family [Algoriphagus ornithinivorans]|tara:strand:+ start:12151 stop:13071 length:921 start_codon:yes stop_codon:yes gene_type:complete
MYLIKKMIVCLDQTSLDKTLIQYAAFIAKVNQTKKIYFVNVIKNLSVPKEVLEEFPNLVESMINERQAAMETVVSENFPDQKGISLNYIVKEGSLSKKVLKLAEEKSADMIIVGRKIHLPGTGVVSLRLARRASCSLLIVPENSQPKVQKILVPSDFSDYSKDALEEAIMIAEKHGNVEIVCQNVFSIPSGYHFTGKSYEEFTQIMQMHAEIAYKKFIRKINTKGIKITPVYTKDEDDDPVQEIVNKALEINADGIIIGAKGRTAATALFIGSMAERLIQFNDSLPLLVTRPKGKNAGILDYILEI